MIRPPLHEAEPKAISQLLHEQDDALRAQQGSGELLRFSGSGERDVYNITPSFTYEDHEVLAARVEAREDELHSQVRFFRLNPEGGSWEYDDTLPTFDLQDPFVAKIHDEWVLGGVKVFPEQDNPDQVASWETHLYAGPDLQNLELVVVGPHKMKDIRPFELPNREIGIFTRPQGEKGGLGMIGYTSVSHLKDAAPDILQDAPLLPGIFAKGEWGGVNDVHVLEDGRVGVIGHIARHGEGGREYYAMAFVFDPTFGETSELKIIADRSAFPQTEAKRSDLREVIFPGGIQRKLGGCAVLFCGISDVCAGALQVSDPF